MPMQKWSGQSVLLCTKQPSDRYMPFVQGATHHSFLAMPILYKSPHANPMLSLFPHSRLLLNDTAIAHLLRNSLPLRPPSPTKPHPHKLALLQSDLEPIPRHAALVALYYPLAVRLRVVALRKQHALVPRRLFVFADAAGLQRTSALYSELEMREGGTDLYFCGSGGGGVGGFERGGEV